ncbi:MAG TPA: hypothetical protein VE548_15900 [Nitrososphaeraceae archaeon]|jgi:hypothetical protein|nr:hypothetical protein [Nitrososphaeraceae archaeon]
MSELVEVCEKILWHKCKICGVIFNEGNNSKQHGCLLCGGDIPRKQEALMELEILQGKRPYPK